VDTKLNQTPIASLADLRAFIGGTPYVMSNKLPAPDATIEDITHSAVFAHLAGRDEYLDWVATYKAWIAGTEAYIRAQKSLRRDPNSNVRSQAQFQAAYAAQCVTIAIRMRRLAKRWSSARRLGLPISPENVAA
jgi:hypothetical protein